MDVANPAAAAAAPTGGDWRSQLHPMAREVMVKQIMKTLRKHLPLTGSEGLSRLQNIADGYEKKFYTSATSQHLSTTKEWLTQVYDGTCSSIQRGLLIPTKLGYVISSYSRMIAMLLIHVEEPNQNPYRQAPGLPPLDNNLTQSSAVTLMPQQQTQQPNISSFVQASSLHSLGQGFTGVSQVSAHTQLMAMQLATQSGIQQNPLNIVQQPMQSLCQQPPQCVEGYQRNPQLSMHQQPSLQQTQLTQEPSIPLQQQPQQLMGLQPNLHQNQLICQQRSAVDMQQQHRLPVQSNNLLNPQHPVPDNVDLSMPHVNTVNFKDLGDNILPDEVWNALSPLEELHPLFPLDGIQDAKGPDQLDIERVDTQMQNNWLHSSRLVAMEEDPNNVSMTDSANNLKKRKFDGSSSSSKPVFGQATSTPVDDHTYAPAPPCPAIPKVASATPPWEFQRWMAYR